MEISSIEFEKSLEKITNNLVYASIHYRLYTDLCNASEEYNIEMNQSPVFWQLTIEAHATSTILMLCQVYDHHKNSFNLPKLLNTIHSNPSLFKKECFDERIKDRPLADDLSKTPRILNNKTLEQHMQYVNKETNPLVRKLIYFRDKQVAHIDKNYVLNAENNSETLVWKEVEELIFKGHEIVSTYESLYRASSWSSNIIGEEDYKKVLNAIRKAELKEI